MNPETHLVVLWEKARSEQERILSDLARHVEIVAKLELSWPGDPQTCFGRFYGAKAALAAGKVSLCGGGPFLAVIVRDGKPRYGWRETSRGFERVNLRMFAIKKRYRAWTGGGHRIHTTNSPAEARRDIYLLTGHPIDEWTAGTSLPRDLHVLTGWNGWRSFKELFSTLNETMPYVVMRNFELLPNAFDPSIHGDIDLLVPDVFECAGILGAVKVFPEPWRVHYEVMVNGRPVRFDFRTFGDGYYDELWERDILTRRICRDGVYMPCPEDAFAMLTYHALLQKRVIARDYQQKICDLARAAGLSVKDIDEALSPMEEFLRNHGYSYSVPADKSVFFDNVLPRWRGIARRIELTMPVSRLVPFHLGGRRAGTELQTLFFSGQDSTGKRCFVKHALVPTGLIENEWAYGRKFYGCLPESTAKPIAYHIWADGSATIAYEWQSGRLLEDVLAADDGNLCDWASLAHSICEFATVLQKNGICHRDIRPANLMIDDNGHLRLIDFQFATDLDAKVELPFLTRNWQCTRYLGEDYAVAQGLWNDRFAFAKIVEQFPPFAGKDTLLQDLRRAIPETMRPVRFRGPLFRRFRKQFFRLKWRNFWRSLKGKMPYEPEMMQFLSSVWMGRPRKGSAVSK